MKRSIKYIITTIILCVVMVCSLFLSAHAVNDSYSLTAGVVRYSGALISSTLSYTPTDFGDAILGVSVGDGFDKYVTTTQDITYNGSTDYLTVALSFGNIFTEDSSDVNSFELRYGLFGSAGETQDSAASFRFVTVTLNGTSILNDLTVTYEISAPISVTIPDGSGSVVYYRTVTAKILCDDSVTFNDGDNLGFSCRSRVLNVTYNGSYLPFRYCFGFSDLSFGFKTVDDYIEDVAKNTSAISSTVTVISGQLATELTPEQQDRMDELTDSIVQAEEHNQVIEDTFNDLASDASIDFDYVAGGFTNTLTDKIGPVYYDDGFNSFWDWIWNNGWIVSAVLMVLAFATVHYIVYGLR